MTPNLDSADVNSSRTDLSQWRRARTVFVYVAIVVFTKVWLAILYEYRNYFPPDFESTFLIGRENYFFGVYGVAFYVHLVSGPVSIVLGALLLWSGLRSWRPEVHRLVGRIQGILVLGAVVPSGLWMASQAFAGPIATAGFIALAIGLAFCMTRAIVEARCKRFALHRRWAARCLVLLISPLILRIVSGAAIIAGLDSDTFYRFNAWGSWLVPLITFEMAFRFTNRRP